MKYILYTLLILLFFSCDKYSEDEFLKLTTDLNQSIKGNDWDQVKMIVSTFDVYQDFNTEQQKSLEEISDKIIDRFIGYRLKKLNTKTIEVFMDLPLNFLHENYKRRIREINKLYNNQLEYDSYRFKTSYGFNFSVNGWKFPFEDDDFNDDIIISEPQGDVMVKGFFVTSESYKDLVRLFEKNYEIYRKNLYLNSSKGLTTYNNRLRVYEEIKKDEFNPFIYHFYKNKEILESPLGKYGTETIYFLDDFVIIDNSYPVLTFSTYEYLFELLRERREDFEKKNEVKSKVSY